MKALARGSTPSRSQSVIDQLFERLTSPSNQIESSVELSSSLQAHHITAQNTICTLKSTLSLEGLLKSPQIPSQPPSSIAPTSPEPAATHEQHTYPQSDSLTEMLNGWKQGVEVVCAQGVGIRARILVSTRNEWEMKLST
jgi:hypothetical protein